ncbi:redox-regulated ATPase YchF [Candidatus Fermentibacterales bacterium]|nr:redox-regulated ATPase YchF [Candidatus Fermentibacterales bacterium]
MHVALVGFPGCGRTTLLRALASNQDADPHKPLTVTVPDPRLESLAKALCPEATTGIHIVFEDVQSPAFSPERLSGVRGSSALALVLDDFCQGEMADRLSEAESELMLSDCMVLEKRLGRLTKEGLRGGREYDLVQRISHSLSNGLPCRAQGLDRDETQMLSSYSLLSLKPLLVVVNRSSEPPEPETTISDPVGAAGAIPVVIDAQFELELSEIPDESERREFLEAMGYESPGLDRMVAAAFSALGLIVFYTVKGTELRAWPLREGASAVEAAGIIHTDMAAGFIRARVADCGAFLECPDSAELRRTGRLRTEGKDYVVRDGDVIEILFN